MDEELDAFLERTLGDGPETVREIHRRLPSRFRRSLKSTRAALERLRAQGRVQLSPPESYALKPSQARLLLHDIKGLRARSRYSLLSIPELRAASSLGPEDFESTLLELSRGRWVVLHRHDHPHGLSEDARRQLVRDAGGRFYVGVELANPDE